MKIIKQVSVIALVISFSISSSIKPSQANPAAFCAGSTGVGCILIGVAVIGGATYYVWQHSNGKRVFSKKNGSIFKIEEPEDFESEVIINTYGSSMTEAQARERCRREVGLHGLEYVTIRKKLNGSFECIGK